jgi:hypothetical protein
MKDICIIGYEPLDNLSSDQTTQVMKKLLYRGSTSFEEYKQDISNHVDSWMHIQNCNGKEKVLGLKARLNSGYINQLINTPSFINTKFIILKRNIIKQSVATYRRKYCGLGQFTLRQKIEQNHSINDINNFKSKKCNIDKLPTFRKLCMYYLAQQKSFYQLTDLNNRILTISYEDIMNNITNVIDNNIVPFLDVSNIRKFDKETTLQKASPDLLCDSLENFSEICQVVRNDMPKEFLNLFNIDSCSRDDVVMSRNNCCTSC